MHVGLASEFAALWESKDSPPDVFAFLQQHSHASSSDKMSVLLGDQQRRWRTDQPIRVEDYLAHLPDLVRDPDLKLQLAVGEFRARQATNSSPNIEEFTSRFSDLGDSLKSKLVELASIDHEKAKDHYVTVPPTPEEAARFKRIGRYRLVRPLGEGAFGLVWLAFDDELRRQVAIKVPKPERFQQPKDAEHYLSEARKVASLDHPHIVPVYDVGKTDNGLVYVVSKFIEGCNLAEQIRRGRPTCEGAATLIATVARALHHAHQKHLIHRDVKPANILIEESTATPYVADFGLAISEEDYLRDGRIAGSPAYMSPEQARGEGHRLDGRSDIFSAGVVLYELLTGKLPLFGRMSNEAKHQEISVDPVPLRELNGSIPAELERICLKALSKRASDRYASAAEMADELSHWQQGPQLPPTEIKIVPKGLRSFEAADADFFLELVPGPRDRHGLPDSIRFWKTHIEETDAHRTFSVGLIYGPSGCGKSSLVEAGLLPRLSKHVISVHVEATGDQTEIRLLKGLRKLCPELPATLGLKDALAALRQGKGIPTGKKVLIVVDQFEQWLHAKQRDENAEMVQALRQCDGSKLQCIVMVRDDFWMAVTRFFQGLDIPLLERQNSKAVDLLPVRHARQVLAAFGRAYGGLSAESGDESREQKHFLDQATADLAEDGEVICVRLALFAEMMKGKSWTPSTLREVGGAEGVGVTFLEEKFSATSAPPEHRLHQKAARSVLKALLPESGTNIKGRMRSYAELLDASSYADRPNDFAKLIHILDSEVRLITPTDPEGKETTDGSTPVVNAGEKYYQLTHDYLVPSLREWLTRKQRETRKGRAELRLSERSVLWNAKPENQQLPSISEYLNIRLLTSGKNWTIPQRKMMRQAARVWGLRSAVAMAMLLVITAVLRWTIVQAKENQRQLALNYLHDGASKAKAGNVREGMQLLYQGLHAAANDDDLVRSSARNLLGGWAQELPLAMRHHEQINAVALAPKGTILATASNDKTVRLWNAKTGEPLHQLDHTGPVHALAFSPDGDVVVTAGDDKTALLWNSENGMPLAGQQTMRHEGPIYAVAFSPDGTTLLTGSKDQTVKFWTSAGEPLADRVLKHDAPVNAIATGYGPDGGAAVVLTGCGDPQSKASGYAQLWSAQTGQPIGDRLRHSGPVMAVALAAGGRMAITGCGLGDQATRAYAQLWSIELKESSTPDHPPKIVVSQRGEPLTFIDNVTAVSFGPDAEQFVTASEHKIQTWKSQKDITPGESIEFEGIVSAIRIGKDGRQLVAWNDSQHEMFVAELRDPPSRAAHGPRIQHHGEVSAVAFGSDDATLLTASWDQTARIWDATTGKSLDELKHESPVYAIASYRDGLDRTLVMTGCSDHLARLWTDFNKPEKSIVLEHKDSVAAVALATWKGRLIALTGSTDRTAKLWDAMTGREHPKLSNGAQDGAVEAVAFTPDGCAALAAHTNGAMELWTVEDGSRRWRTAPGKASSIHAVAISPDGQLLATGSHDGQLRFWEVSSGQSLAGSHGLSNDVLHRPLHFERNGVAAPALPEIRPLKHAHPIWGVAFSPDGRIVFSGCGTEMPESGYAQFWDWMTGEPLGKPLLHPARVNAVAYDHRGRMVLTGADDGQVRCWDAPQPPPKDPVALEAWFAIRLQSAPAQSGGFQQLSADDFFTAWQKLNAASPP